MAALADWPDATPKVSERFRPRNRSTREPQELDKSLVSLFLHLLVEFVQRFGKGVEAVFQHRLAPGLRRLLHLGEGLIHFVHSTFDTGLVVRMRKLHEPFRQSR